MTSDTNPVAKLSDEALLLQVRRLLSDERRATSLLVASLAELDVRRLYLGEGFKSLFAYCVEHLHMSERAAYARIAAARISRRFSVVLLMLERGDITLTTISLLAPHLTNANHSAVLNEARHKTKEQVEELVARLAPQPDAPSLIRKEPAVKQAPIRSDQADAAPLAGAWVEPTTAAEPDVTGSPVLPSAAMRPVVKPLAPARYKVQFTVDSETHDLLRQAQHLLKHTIPTGDPALIFNRALKALLGDLERRKLALVALPRHGKGRAARTDTRGIPAAVRREVWRRDKGRCAFVGAQGRCRERGALELHHVVPFAAGGQATTANIQLRCRAHNAHEADIYFSAKQGP